MRRLVRFLHSRRVRNAWLPVAARCGMLRRAERRCCGALTVLTYHRVLPDGQANVYPFGSLAMPVSVFREQMAWLKGKTVLPVSEAIRHVIREPGSRPFLSVTFDDGYWDNAEFAAPILDEAGLRATFFVTAGVVQDRGTLWFDRAYAVAHAAGMADAAGWVRSLKQLSPGEREQRIADPRHPSVSEGASPLMTPQQVRQLAERGHEIASHTMTHPILTRVSGSELAAELAESRALLREWSGQNVEGVCYPNGDCDERVIVASRQAGYTYGCTTVSGNNAPGQDPMTLRRVHVDPRRVTRNGRHDPLLFRAELCFPPLP